jgi:predicted ATPase
MERGLALYEQVPHVSQTYLYGGHDPGACCRYHLTVNLWLLGYPDRSLQALVDALRLSKELKHPLTRVVTLWYVAWVHYQRGERTAMRAMLEQLLALGKEHGISSMMGASIFLLDTDTILGEQELAALIEKLRGTWASASWQRVFCMCVLAGRCIDEHYTDEGLSILASISTDDRGAFYAPEIHRLEGELRRGLPSPDAKQIETCFRAAIALANQRKEKSLELRAAVSLARFWHDQGKPHKARELLAPVYGSFTEGFETLDLKEAKALLDELAV